MLRLSRTSWHSVAALVTGIAAILVVGIAERRRETSAAVRLVADQALDQIHGRIERARSQAQLLAGNTEVREGVSQHNRLILRRALRPALAQMDVNYVGIVAPDGTSYFALPSDEIRAPVIASRVPIEHELQTIAHLEYGVVLDDEFLQRTGAATGGAFRVFDPRGTPVAGSAAVPPPTLAGADLPARSVVNGVAYVPLRAAGGGPVKAILGFHVPAAGPRTARIRAERNILWLLIVLIAGAVVTRDLRRSRPAAPPRPYAAIPNPYIVGNPLRTQDMFFGRDDDFQFARQKLTSERAGLVMVFCGERRSGKTSILFQILSGRLGPGFLPVLIDMQYFAAISGDRDLYRNIYREIARAVYPEAEQKDRLARFDAIEADNPGQVFEQALDEAMATQPDRALLLLFDEYEILESKIERGELTRNVIPFLAGMLERKRRMAYIFTGSKNLEERATEHWRVMLGKSLYRKISFLTRQDTERLICEPVRGVVDYDAAAVARIVRLTSGQPFYTQVICQNLVDHLNEVRRSRVSLEDVEAIVDGVVDNPLPQMIYFWDSLPSDEKLALSLFGEALEDEGAWMSPAAAMADVSARGVPLVVTETQLQGACERLFDTEILAKSRERLFQYRIDLLRHWIRRTHSIWQVVKESGNVSSARA